jgi:hypothetical protein
MQSPKYILHPNINWTYLSANPRAMVLEANLDKINWSNLSQNPSAITRSKS